MTETRARTLRSDILRPHMSAHKRIVIAVSGGSDSLALLHLCAEYVAREQPDLRLFAATVNHGLRPQAAREARTVKGICRELGLPHKTLRLAPAKVKNAQNLRHGRYESLARFAERTAASAIFLAHTQNDQSETLLMRASRMGADSHTGGLAAMAAVTSYDSIKLVRPLLDQSRERLRDYLRAKSVDWFEDPSNEDPSFERSRVRHFLGESSVPQAHSARLAHLCGLTRRWLNGRVSELLAHHARFEGEEAVFAPPRPLPEPIVGEIFGLLVRLAGAKPFRPAPGKLEESVKAFQAGETNTRTAGGAIIRVANGTARIRRECRGGSGKKPDFPALTRFRPSFDDCLYDWAAKARQVEN